MPFVPAADTTRFAFTGTLPRGQNFAWILHYFRGAGVAQTQALVDTRAGDFLNALVVGGVIGQLHVNWTITQTVATDLTTSGGIQHISTAANGAGTNTGEPLPPTSSLVVSWRTALSGRSHRGRSYIGGFTELDSNGAPVAGVLSNAQAFANDLIGAWGTGGDFLAIVSNFSGSTLTPISGGQIVKRPTPRAAAVITPVTRAIIDPIWHVQRRRAA